MNFMDGQRKTKCMTGFMAAINKHSTTHYAKGFLRDKKYENPGKYYPGTTLAELSIGNRFQTSESNFYNGKQPPAGPKGFYTTTQNFAVKKPYENEYQM